MFRFCLKKYEDKSKSRRLMCQESQLLSFRFILYFLSQMFLNLENLMKEVE